MKSVAITMAVCFSALQPAGDGVTEYGRQFPVIVERALDEAGERGENGWGHVLDVSRIVREGAGPAHGEPGAANFDSLSQPGEWSEEERALALKTLKELEEQGLFTALDALAAARRVVQPAMKGDMFAWELPELTYMRLAMRAASARMALAAERGDGAEAARSLEHSLALGRVGTYCPVLIGRLVGIACIARGFSDLQRAMPRLSAADLRACEAPMSRQLRLAPLSMTFEGERLMQLDAVRMVYGDGDRPRAGGLGKMVDVGLEGALAAGGVEGAVRKAEAVAFAEAAAARWIAMSKLPAREMLAEADAIEAKEVPESQLVAGLMMPALRRAVAAEVQIEALMSGMRAMVAVELWQREHGAYPASLAEVKGEFVDPYTGGALKYVRLEAKDDAGRGYVLYSVGLDGVDDGGKEHEKSAYVAATPKGKGFDFVINARKP